MRFFELYSIQCEIGKRVGCYIYMTRAERWDLIKAPKSTEKCDGKARIAWVFGGEWRIVVVLGGFRCAGVLLGTWVRHQRG